MTSDMADTKSKQVTLVSKTLGKLHAIGFGSVSDAANYAISLISAGTAIPKSISIGQNVVLTEADINLHWESARHLTRGENE